MKESLQTKDAEFECVPDALTSPSASAPSQLCRFPPRTEEAASPGPEAFLLPGWLGVMPGGFSGEL